MNDERVGHWHCGRFRLGEVDAERCADLMVPHAPDNVFAVDMIVAKIQDSVHAEGALP